MQATATKRIVEQYVGPLNESETAQAVAAVRANVSDWFLLPTRWLLPVFTLVPKQRQDQPNGSGKEGSRSQH
jgi:hypothetical protein